MSVVWPVLPQGFLALGWCLVTGSGAGWAMPSSGSPRAAESTELAPSSSAYGFRSSGVLSPRTLILWAT